MQLNVKQRGDHVATFRWVAVRFMETLAAWVPTTPEMEVKLVFGTHIWDMAQHADALGKRTHELRLPLHDSLRPADAYVALLTEVAEVAETDRRVAAFYDALLPGLERRLRDYLRNVDTLLDGPTVRIVERILVDITRMVADSRTMLDEVPAVRLADPRWLDGLRQREVALNQIVVYRGSDPATVSVA
jgi:hypothetical protein